LKEFLQRDVAVIASQIWRALKTRVLLKQQHFAIASEAVAQWKFDPATDKAVMFNGQPDVTIPAGAQHTLATARRAAVVTDLRRRTVLRQVLSWLSGDGIEAVLLKGAALANAVYPESYLRPMTDVDIRVPGAQLTAAVNGLLENGFEVPEGGLADGRVSPTLDQRRLRDIRSGVRVELHGSVRSLECLSKQRVEQCWTRSVPLRANGISARMLCPADALVHTCLHLAMTNRFADSQLALLDVALLADRCGGELDWGAIAREATAEGIAVYLTVALTVAREVWSARVPDEYFAAIGEVHALAEMEALAIEQVWERSPELPSALEQAFREPGSATRVTSLLRRIFVHPWKASAGETRNPWQKARQAADLLVTDVTVKLPRYIRAWARGDLARRELRRRAGLAARRGRLGMLAREAQARLGDVRQ
jgi:hypothetical protein